MNSKPRNHFVLFTIITSLFLFTLSFQSANGQTATLKGVDSSLVDMMSIGVIADSNLTILGTGFVLSIRHVVITCAHVIPKSKKTLFYIPYNSNVAHKIKFVMSRNIDDLAICILETKISGAPLRFDISKDPALLDTIYYAGYDSSKSDDTHFEITVGASIVTSVGKYYDDKRVVDFIEFTGSAIPGFSGGPVFNRDRKVIGVISQAFFKQGLHDTSPLFLINRAVSIKPATKNIKQD